MSARALIQFEEYIAHLHLILEPYFSIYIPQLMLHYLAPLEPSYTFIYLYIYIYTSMYICTPSMMNPLGSNILFTKIDDLRDLNMYGMYNNLITLSAFKTSLKTLILLDLSLSLFTRFIHSITNLISLVPRKQKPSSERVKR